MEVVGFEGLDKIASIINKSQNPMKQEPLPPFKGYDDRLITCNGDCGSKFSKVIDHCLHQRVCGNIF